MKVKCRVLIGYKSFFLYFSIIYAPYIDNDSKVLDSTSDNAANSDLPTNAGPYRRPNIDANKFLNSSFSNIDNSKS